MKRKTTPQTNLPTPPNGFIFYTPLAEGVCYEYQFTVDNKAIKQNVTEMFQIKHDIE